MPKQVESYTLLVSCPSDVSDALKHLSRRKNGNGSPSVATLARIAAGLGAS